MLIRRILFVVPLLLIAALSGQENPPKPRAESRFGSHLPPAAIAAMQSIRADNIETHVRFLSHDLLEGRGTGQRGGDIAAEYMATQFALYGLKPAGDNGSYMQKVPLEGISTQDDSTLSLVPSNGAPLDLAFRKDFVVTDESGAARSDIDT